MSGPGAERKLGIVLLALALLALGTTLASASESSDDDGTVAVSFGGQLAPREHRDGWAPAEWESRTEIRLRRSFPAVAPLHRIVFTFPAGVRLGAPGLPACAAPALREPEVEDCEGALIGAGELRGNWEQARSRHTAALRIYHGEPGGPDLLLRFWLHGVEDRPTVVPIRVEDGGDGEPARMVLSFPKLGAPLGQSLFTVSDLSFSIPARHAYLRVDCGERERIRYHQTVRLLDHFAAGRDRVFEGTVSSRCEGAAAARLDAGAGRPPVRVAGDLSVHGEAAGALRLGFETSTRVERRHGAPPLRRVTLRLGRGIEFAAAGDACPLATLRGGDPASECGRALVGRARLQLFLPDGHHGRRVSTEALFFRGDGGGARRQLIYLFAYPDEPQQRLVVPIEFQRERRGSYEWEARIELPELRAGAEVESLGLAFGAPTAPDYLRGSCPAGGILRANQEVAVGPGPERHEHEFEATLSAGCEG